MTNVSFNSKTSNIPLSNKAMLAGQYHSKLEVE